MRGFGWEPTDERWVELRFSTSSVYGLGLFSATGEHHWPGADREHETGSGWPRRPEIDHIAWEAISPIAAETFVAILGAGSRARPPRWSPSGPTRIRADLGFALKDLFDRVKASGPRPSMGVGTYEEYRRNRDDYLVRATAVALEWAFEMETNQP